MELSSELLKILVCPVTTGPLFYDRETMELVSVSASLAYPIKDGIPLLLADHARKISLEEVAKYTAQSSKDKAVNDTRVA